MDTAESYHWASMIEYYNGTDKVFRRLTHADKEGSNHKQSKKVSK